MIFVRDKGRMCNNILQYGHAYAWASEHGRKILSMRFSYKYQYFRLCHEHKHNFISYLAGKYGAKLGFIPTISFLHSEDEGDATLEKKMFSTTHFILEGWYIRFYDLFIKHKEEIIHMFAFDNKIVSKIKDYISKNTRPSDTILGVHIRRGDYKTFKGGQYFYSDEVYIEYIRQFVMTHSDRHITVFICGNDPNLATEKYFAALQNCSIYFPTGNPAEDLCLLSECNYLIGPPSTFSLVAAMYHDIPLLWMQTDNSNSVKNEGAWGKFDKLFREII